MRRLLVLLNALPPEATLYAALALERERSLKSTPEKIRERQEFYAKQRAKEAP